MRVLAAYCHPVSAWRVRMATQVFAAATSGTASEMPDAELISKVGKNLVQNVKTKEVVWMVV